MRKIISALLLLTLILLFAATYVCSNKTETVFAEQVALLNQQYPGALKVQSDYQRGFLLSVAQTRIELPDEELILVHKIRHLPWKVQIISRLAAGSELANALAEQGLLEELKLQTDVSLQGDASSNLTLPQLSFAKDGNEMTLANLHFNCALTAGLNALELSLQLDALQLLEGGKTRLQLKDLRLETELSDQQGLPIGRGELSFGGLQLQVQEGPLVADNLRYIASSELQGASVASSLDLLLQRLQLAGEEFSDARLQLAISGLDAATLRELQQNGRELQQQFVSGQVDPLILQLQLFALYGQLFQQGVKLSITELAVLSEQGSVSGKGEFSLPPGEATAGLMAFQQLLGDFQLQLDQPFFNAGFRLLDRLQSDGRKRNRAVLDEQAEQLAGGLVQKGILRRTDSGYRLDFSLQQGQGRLNGQPLRL